MLALKRQITWSSILTKFRISQRNPTEDDLEADFEGDDLQASYICTLDHSKD
jgi:hypothetical protein